MASGQARKSSSSDTKKQRFKQVGGRSSLKNEECEICNSCVDIDQKGIECEICKHWFHANCVDIEDNEYEVLTNHKKGSIHWYCEKCNVKSVELFTVVFNIQEKMQKSEMELEKMKNETNAKFQKIETEYDAMRQDLRTLNKKIEEGVQKCLDDSDKLVKSTHQQTITLHKDVEKEMIKTKAEVDSELQKIHTVVDDLHTEFNSFKNINKAVDFNEIVKQQMEDEVRKNAEFTEKIVEDKLKITSKAVEEMSNKFQESKSYFEEEQDKEIRRNNIIIYRMPEHLEVSIPEERKVLDKRFVLNLFSNMQAGIIEEDVRATLRLGRLTVQGSADTATGRATANPRPVLVQFTNRMAKNLVMNNLYKLKNLEEKFKNLSIAHDMTKQERKECKDLVEEAKKQSAEDTTGNYIYRARGAPGAMQIVRLRKMH